MKLQIYDNTLRDGEQQIGVSFSKKDKILIAKKISEIGVKNIEAGFIAVSENERKIIKDLNQMDIGANIFCLARLRREDIDLAIKCGVKNITIFTCASDILLKYKLHKTAAEVLEKIKYLISYCKEHSMYVRFSCEDATRTDIERLVLFYNTAYEYGADYVSVPDTCGVGTPETIGNLIKSLKHELKLPISIHCHNDLGLALSNTIAAVKEGVDEVQLTINGLGERAGNTAFEEFVMAMKVGYDVTLPIKYDQIMKLSKLVEKLSGERIGNNKPIVGKNAFCHESGLHVAALLKNQKTYEAFSPSIIGRKHTIAFGKHSGKANIEFLLRKHSVELSDQEKESLVTTIKKKAEEEGKSSRELYFYVNHLILSKKQKL